MQLVVVSAVIVSLSPNPSPEREGDSPPLEEG